MVETQSKTKNQYSQNSANIDANFGPWDSIDSYISWLSAWGLEKPQDGTFICVNDGTGTLEFKVYQYGTWTDANKAVTNCDGGLLGAEESATAMGKKYLKYVGGKICKVEWREDGQIKSRDCDKNKLYACGGKLYVYDGTQCNEVGSGLTASERTSLNACIQSYTEQARDISTLKQQISSLIGLDGSNFLGIHSNLEDTDLEVALTRAGKNKGAWILYGESLESLVVYVWDVEDQQWLQFSTDTYDFTDMGDIKEGIRNLAYTTDEGFRIIDEGGNVGLKLTNEGMDWVGKSTMLQDIYSRIGSGTGSGTGSGVSSADIATYIQNNMKYLKIGNNYFSLFKGIADATTAPSSDRVIDVVSFLN